MGLFSKFSKNKQDGAGEDSGFYTADDQGATAKARSKRASNAGNSAGAGPRRGGKDAADPVLPEKKRARRRLVGAVALALGVAVGLPMLLDSEPKPLASDIAIQIPSKDKPAAQHGAATSASGSVSSRVAAGDALDQSEEIVDDAAAPVPAAPVKVAPTPVAPPVLAEVKTHIEPKPVKPEAPKVEAKVATKPDAPKAEGRVAPKPELKPEPKPKPESKPHETRQAEAKPVEPKPVEPKPAAKPAQPAEDATRALAILEGKPAVKPQEAGSGKFVVQVAALATQDKVDELQGRLKEAGIHSYTQKVPTPTGERIRVRVGPFGSKEDAEKARAKLSKLGLGGSLVPA
ncbi:MULTISPECIES: SPOR domain-containing protein [unclassified Janthinobacterium]|uniref:SPOR domain-containing protein n=1 Tax=unclassified Janthinobacterium TaxID=2610881 RepID=UPI000347B665|nr:MULTISPECIES: SPOR domain-containing protein [unclassified Janthinobacterium]MEC5161401.1 DedD protein [Janthinobacterium sp. CG_S6]